MTTPVGSCVSRLTRRTGSLALRPARLLAPTNMVRLLSSFRRVGRPNLASTMTTRANSLFPRPDFHRQDTPPYGLRNYENSTRPGTCARRFGRWKGGQNATVAGGPEAPWRSCEASHARLTRLSADIMFPYHDVDGLKIGESGGRPAGMRSSRELRSSTAFCRNRATGAVPLMLTGRGIRANVQNEIGENEHDAAGSWGLHPRLYDFAAFAAGTNSRVGQGQRFTAPASHSIAGEADSPHSVPDQIPADQEA